jgi:hypothetical protein
MKFHTHKKQRYILTFRFLQKPGNVLNLTAFILYKKNINYFGNSVINDDWETATVRETLIPLV